MLTDITNREHHRPAHAYDVFGASETWEWPLYLHRREGTSTYTYKLQTVLHRASNTRRITVSVVLPDAGMAVLVREWGQHDELPQSVGHLVLTPQPNPVFVGQRRVGGEGALWAERDNLEFNAALLSLLQSVDKVSADRLRPFAPV